jgi:anti-sigma regulatory factor (Ser/Thr protein kinase)
MSEVRQAVRAAALTAVQPSQVLVRANQMLTMRNRPTMVTAIYGTYDPLAATFTYASAGQPPPLLGSPEGRVQQLPAGGLPLGIVDDIDTCDWTFTLMPGALLVLYTDGLIEFSRDLFEGEALLRDAVATEIVTPSQSPARTLTERVFANSVNTDDVATLTLFATPRRLESFHFTFSAVPIAAPLVRRALERFAGEIGLDDERRFALLSAVGEAVANAIEHAYEDSPGTVRLTARHEGDSVRVQVEDSGRWRAVEKRDERGRGIPLMRALMDGVEIRTDRSSTKVRLRIKT